MFTGIVQSIGVVRQLSRNGGDASLLIDVGRLPVDRLTHGASIAVNGACLTVTASEGATARRACHRCALSASFAATLTSLAPASRQMLTTSSA